MASRLVLYLLCFLVIFHACVWCCSRDSDCTRNFDSQQELCCNGVCKYWASCSHGCKDNGDCDSSRKQICHRHRCTEDSVTYPDGRYPCTTDAECYDGDRCEENFCSQISTLPPHSPDRLATWIKVVLISGSVIFAFLLGIVIYCYRRKCSSLTHGGHRCSHLSRRRNHSAHLQGNMASPTIASQYSVDGTACIQMSDIPHDIDRAPEASSMGPPPLYSTIPSDLSDIHDRDEFAPPCYTDAITDTATSTTAIS